MRKLLSLTLALLMTVSCLMLASCGKAEEVTVTRSFLAGYENSVAMGDTDSSMSGRVLMNLLSDGTLDIYVGLDAMGEHKTARYSGTYTLGENAEFDETISFTYTYAEGQTETVTDAVIIDGIFETPFYMIASMTSNEIKFYETAPVAIDGDVYIGYLTKTGGMGSMVYAYALCMREDGTFDVSIMQMASVMHVWGSSTGTYTADDDKLTFTYDVSDGEGGIATEGYTSEGTRVSDTVLSLGFNIAQTSVRASEAPFIKVK